MVFLRLLTGGTRSKTPSSHNVFLLVFPQRVIYNPCPYTCCRFNFTKKLYIYIYIENFAWPIDHQLLQEASIYDRLILGLNVNIQFLKSAIISTPVHISCRVLPSLERLALMLWDCCGPGG